MRPRLAAALTTAAALAVLAPTAQATPVVAAATVRVAPASADCAAPLCLRLRVRASEPDQYPGELLRWRVTATRLADGARVGNWTARFPNNPEAQTWVMRTRHRPAAGRYAVRVSVTSGRGTTVRDRVVVVR